jgi:hypothetical protein
MYMYIFFFFLRPFVPIRAWWEHRYFKRKHLDYIICNQNVFVIYYYYILTYYVSYFYNNEIHEDILFFSKFEAITTGSSDGTYLDKLSR